MIKNLVIIILVTFSIGCATASGINRVKLGMTKKEVVEIMGSPVSVSAINGTEYLNYKLYENLLTDYYATPYYIRIINNKVESFGRSGDFDSEKTPTIRIEKDETIKQDTNIKTDDKKDLYTELMKLKELKDQKLLTDEEFELKRKELIKETK